ncbi:hypothetical protein DXG03_007844 [Asterophora parasitica]|uniref:phosphatidylserine decarboxylase n=1 Tax=Asterophora parasitica TaxID=117018 RepID=A0A9P7GII3_9AGAR|nr:hypothetical protein DXG03_007844 [Asterophora parasitica]
MRVTIRRGTTRRGVSTKFQASLPKSEPTPTVEKIHPDNLPDADEGHLSSALTALVDRSATHPDVSQNIHTPMHCIPRIEWIHSLVPGLEELSATYHIGNFVLVRETEEMQFEHMPIYARVGMHLVFYGYGRARVLGTRRVEDLLRKESIRQGRIYDSSQSAHSIPSFVKTYNLTTEELLEPDLSKYACFNEFFSRKLKADARAVADAEDPFGVCSAADSRLTVYPSVDSATKFWIKGRQFTIPALLGVASSSMEAETFEGASLAIFRLAPADYHRFHAPLACETINGPVDLPGQYYTVNPQAVNEPGFDVFTANRRSILYLKHAQTGRAVAVVAIGALLVGSVCWTGGAKKGTKLERGDELGYFAYGGSTVVVLFSKAVVEFDEDLIRNSMKPIETLVKVRNRILRFLTFMHRHRRLAIQSGGFPSKK